MRKGLVKSPETRRYIDYVQSAFADIPFTFRDLADYGLVKDGEYDSARHARAAIRSLWSRRLLAKENYTENGRSVYRLHREPVSSQGSTIYDHFVAILRSNLQGRTWYTIEQLVVVANQSGMPRHLDNTSPLVGIAVSRRVLEVRVKRPTGNKPQYYRLRGAR